MKPIIITGNIGSGKSTLIKGICGEFPNIRTFSFDDFTKELYQQPEIVDFLIEHFGTADKSTVSDLIFGTSGDEMREKLNSHFYKLVEEKFVDLVTVPQDAPLLIEMPLYFEMLAKSQSMQMLRNCVYVVTVIADDSVRIERVKNRDGFTLEKIQVIMNKQMDQQEKVAGSDFCLDNTEQLSFRSSFRQFIQTFKSILETK